MLEKKDIEMIAEIVGKTVSELNKPIYERLDKMDSRLDKMDSRLDKMDSRLDKMDSRLDKMDSRLNKVESKVTEVQMTLENETNKNISIIAEGHLDLSRKLDNALKIENEKEMLLLRVTRLENELRRLKAKIEEIA
jgi:DNA anti-recombination protein RmuC